MSLYQAASALNANSRWQEVISENMASSAIPGFKKQDMSFEAVKAGMFSPTTGSRGAGQAVSFPNARNTINFAPGEVKRTDVNTDFAIEGSAFFEVQLPNGSTAYTRDGEFKINAQGQLVTKQGYMVMGEGGAIQLDRSNSVGITASPDGSINQGDELRGKLNLVTFNDPNLLTPSGGGLFVAKDPGLHPTGESDATIRQGFLEGSNSSSVLEMANLMSVMRAYEANQRVIQIHDDRMSRTISELGNPS